MKQIFSTVKLASIGLFLSFAAKAQDSLVFGDKNWVNSGIEGKIYFLPESTGSLPDFDTLKSVGHIYTKEINVPAQSWDNGFPGVGDRFEWFGIEYKSTFTVKKAGHYSFRLNSDDGAKLFIDGKLVVDNDGLHPPSSKSGEIDLDNSQHSFTLQYYQGPRYDIALQLFYSVNNQEEKIFSSGQDFILTTPGAHNSILISWWFLVILLIFLIVLLAWLKRKKRIVIPVIYSGRI